jgi:hypothetical protein
MQSSGQVSEGEYDCSQFMRAVPVIISIILRRPPERSPRSVTLLELSCSSDIGASRASFNFMCKRRNSFRIQCYATLWDGMGCCASEVSIAHSKDKLTSSCFNADRVFNSISGLSKLKSTLMCGLPCTLSGPSKDGPVEP